jgi:hypothetical protein
MRNSTDYKGKCLEKILLLAILALLCAFALTSN